jgi:subtilase family serine protease
LGQPTLKQLQSVKDQAAGSRAVTDGQTIFLRRHCALLLKYPSAGHGSTDESRNSPRGIFPVCPQSAHPVSFLRVDVRTGRDESPMKRLWILSLGLLLLSGPQKAVRAAQAPPVRTPELPARIVDGLDETRLATVTGNTHPAATAQNDRGRVSPDLPMTDLILVLSRSAEQQAAFDAFVASQYNPSSPNFHHWLEPEEVGNRFGPAAGDIAAVAGWLSGHGLSVDAVAKNRMSIRFSGNAAQVESAFHTEIHNLTVRGEQHIGNMTDPQIPAALSPLVVGVKALHNFFPRPLHKLGGQVAFNQRTGRWERTAGATAASARPRFGINDPTYGLVEDVAPYDFAAIYNVLPLWSNHIDGSGQTIAIAGTSSIDLSDIAVFRSTFGLPPSVPAIVSGNGTTPTICTSTSKTAVCGIDDLIENSLDVEWAGALAKGASIVLVTSYPKSSSDDALYDSASYIVNNKTASILNVSYGECELFMGTAGNQEYSNLWQTAATEGIAVFVSSGDSGSASCDEGRDVKGTPYRAEYGLSVNGLASTQYDTAVGGTDFNWGTAASSYWSSTNNSTTGSNALGYIPEVPWNDTCTNPILVSKLNNETKDNLTATQMCDALYTGQVYSSSNEAGLLALIDTVGGSGGNSTCTASNATTVASCTGGYAKPGWQTAATPEDGTRDIPDVSFFASNGFLGSAYLMCVSAEGSCTYSASSAPLAQEVGGTSVASPAMAGVMALINQYAGASQGNPNTELYTLAALQNYAGCSAESVTASSSCYFNDIDTGTIAMPCDYSDRSPNCAGTNDVGILSGYSATTGYDQATGLGSLNIANVVNAWPVYESMAIPTVTVSPSAATISIQDNLTVTVSVAGSGSLGTPTGTVTLSSSGYTSGLKTLAGGSFTFAIPAGNLSAGNYTLTAAYSGNTTYIPASGTAQVTVTRLTPTVIATPATFSLNVNSPLNVTATVTGSGTTPTGTVQLTGGGYTSPATTLNNGSAVIGIPARSLAVGADTLTVSYAPDSTSSAIYNAASGSSSPVTVTIIGAATPAFNVAAGTYTAAQTVTISDATAGATIYYTTNGTAPTTNSPVYSGPITVSSTETLEAMATATGYTASSVASAVYTITPPAATPAFSVPAGTYAAAQTVTISDATVGATIYFTTNGTAPTASSPVYSGPIAVSSTETLEAMATATGYTASSVASAAYTITPPAATPAAATPAFSVPAGTYTAAQTVTISDATAGATIYYTTSGTAPTTSSPVYSGPITVSSTETLEAMATAPGYTASPLASAAYTIAIPTNPVPVITGMSPAFTNAGATAFTLTISGTGFIPGSTAYWGTAALTTQFVSATQLTAQVAPADIASAGSLAVTVQTPTPGGGTSNSMQFEVDTAGSTTTAPTFTTLTATVAPGSAASYPVTLPASVTSAAVTCLNLPNGATCSYSSTTGAVTIATSSTTPAGTYQITVVFTETVSGAAAAGILLPILLIPLVLLKKKIAARGIWFSACLGLVLMAAAAFSSGCGGGGSSSATTTPTNPTHQVTSSGAVSLTIQ